MNFVKIKNISLIIISNLMMTSCASFYYSELTPKQKNNNLLPALEPKIDISSFEVIYTSGELISNQVGYGTSVSKNSAIIASSSTTTMYKEERIQDAVTIFDRDVKNNITNAYGEKKGSILCKVAAGHSKHGGGGFQLLSGLSLFTLNFLGLPFGNHQTFLDVDVEIYDNSENLIGKYNSHSYNKIWIAMYYGYKANSAYRESSTRALISALNDIKAQIDKDSKRLIDELSK